MCLLDRLQRWARHMWHMSDMKAHIAEEPFLASDTDSWLQVRLHKVEPVS